MRRRAHGAARAGVERALQRCVRMTNEVLYASLSVTGSPAASTLLSVDGGLMTAIGLGVFLVCGVLVSAALRSARRRQRLSIRGVVRARRAAA
jgi:hypothetical protein